MDIATGAMNTLLPKLWELVVGEYKLQKGVKGEIEELEEELTSMTAALRKVAAVPADQLDEQVKIWARDVRELSYDIEDAVDTFMLKGKGHEPAKNFKGLIDRATNLFNKAKTNHQIHSVIKDIMDKVKKARERHDRCRVDDIAARPTTVDVDPRLEAMYRKATELVGIGGPKNELAKRLLEQGSSLRQQQNIISIVGSGGLGKTTLANSLLQDLKSEFDCHFLVSVSLNPDIKNIFKNILLQLDEKKYAHIDEAWETMQLIDKIRGHLESRRFLCVIDDVWKESAWETIKLAVQDTKNGSKIIITTRNKAVGEHAGGCVYELKPLSDDDSRNLFYKRIFDSKDDCPPDLREVTEKILQKCGGVPLAIITTASLLTRKPRHSQEWEKVNKSISFGLGDSLDVDRMRKILSLSYDDLPFHLKTCLLSLSKYPEDELIRKDVLIWSWIAEGFITEEARSTGTSLQDIGDNYFNELINRSLIQPMKLMYEPYWRQDGEVHACKVHDMVLELINQLSAEENFVTTYLSDGQQAGAHTSPPLKKNVRRLSLHYSGKSFASLEARQQLPKVRSLAVFGKVDSIPPLSSFHVLRVLQIEDCTELDKNRHLSDLVDLRFLRFLCLRGYSATELPESIGKLECLETLDIRHADAHRHHDVQLPKSFGKLQKLVRLFAGGVKLAQGLRLGDMKSLQELGLHSNPEIKEFGDLKELRVLRINFSYDDANAEDFVGSILRSVQRCTSLQDLDMQIHPGEGSTELLGVQQVPSGLQRFVCNHMLMRVLPRWTTPSCLTTLSIWLGFDYLLPGDLERLAKLPSIRFLRLGFIEPSQGLLQKRITIQSGAFRCLREFHFYAELMVLSVQPGAMPQLQRLCISNARLKRCDINDLGLENLHSLRHFIMNGSYKEIEGIKTCAVEALKDHPNHPSLEFNGRP